MRTGRITRCSFIALMLALLLGGLAGFDAPVRAAGTIECAPATPIAASPVAAAATEVAPPVAAATFPEAGGSLTVFAAASLTDSFNQIKSDLEAAHPGLTITYNFAGSQGLVTQLSEGATADVFASASKKQMDAAAEKGVIAGKPVTFAQNRLAIVVPKDNPAGIATYADLATPGVKLVLAQPEVPVGQYARDSICKASREEADADSGFAASVAANIVSEEENVKAVLTKVRLGEADAGIVYTTDVTAEVAPDVTVIEIPQAQNVIATYPIAAVRKGNAELAAAFISYVTGPEGQATLASFGFEPKP